MRFKTISSLVKCFLDDNFDDKSEFKKASCFKNEIFRFGICYTSDKQEVFLLHINSQINKFITVKAIGHVPVQKAAEINNHDDYYLRICPGIYPDILLPLGNKNRITASENLQSLFIEVTADKSITAGTYPIEISFVSESDASLVYKTVFELDIINAVLPEQKVKYTQWFYCDCLMDYYGTSAFDERHWEIIENYMRTAVKYGINMILTPVFTPPLDTYIGGERSTTQLVAVKIQDGKYYFDFTKLERWISLCEKCGIRYFEISHFFTQWGAEHAPKIIAQCDGQQKRIFGWDTDASGNEYIEFLSQFIPQLLKILKKCGVDERCYFHISDEPTENSVKQYKKLINIIEPLLEGHTIIDAVSDYCFYESGIVKNPIPSTNCLEKFIENNVSELWTYYCCGQSDDYYSNRFISMPSARNRIIGIQMYKYNISGFLHWGYNYYNNRYSYDRINPFLYPDSNYFGCAGDSFSVYPSNDGAAYESLRLAVFHDALQDIRAFELCEKLYGRDYVINIIEDGISPVTFNRYPHGERYILSVRERINSAVKQAVSDFNRSNMEK